FGLFLVNYFRYFHEGYDVPVVINWDALSDVSRAIYMNFSGIESSDTNFIYPPNGTQPYHYFEAWSVAALSFPFGSNFWVTQNLIFQPLILGLSYLGFRSLSGAKPFHLPAI